ncbi:hypothetical protein [Methylosinus sp. RM1]|uniref:hypothetical protein n=1 Tax=Methylosinus sp. RM1 TaxID=2583817 RepID=UPI00140A023A|nr:hypothetical protein [Methylosinus sp. RM1]
MTKRRPKGDGEKNGRERQSEAAIGRHDQSTIGFQRFMSCHRAIFSDWWLMSDEAMWMRAIRLSLAFGKVAAGRARRMTCSSWA